MIDPKKIEEMKVQNEGEENEYNSLPSRMNNNDQSSNQMRI